MNPICYQELWIQYRTDMAIIMVSFESQEPSPWRKVSLVRKCHTEILCSCLLAPPSTHCLIFIDFSVLDFTWVKHLICGLIVMPGLLSLIMFWGSFNLWHESVMDSLPLPIVHSLYGYAHLSFNKHMSWLYLWLLWIMKLENCIDSLCFHLSSIYF